MGHRGELQLCAAKLLGLAGMRACNAVRLGNGPKGHKAIVFALDARRAGATLTRLALLFQQRVDDRATLFNVVVQKLDLLGVVVDGVDFFATAAHDASLAEGRTLACHLATLQVLYEAVLQVLDSVVVVVDEFWKVADTTARCRRLDLGRNLDAVDLELPEQVNKALVAAVFLGHIGDHDGAGVDLGLVGR